MSKSVKPTISKIVLEIGDQAIEMSVEQARELLDVLQDTFGEKEGNTIVVAPDHHHHWPYRWDVTINKTMWDADRFGRPGEVWIGDPLPHWNATGGITSKSVSTLMIKAKS